MKFSYSILVFLSSCFSYGDVKRKPEQPLNQVSASFYDFKLLSIDGKVIDFSTYKGKKVLIVNTASKCGFTPQYKDLERFYEKYKDKVVVLGFPCNDFGQQEPGNAKEIKGFCEENYGISFQLFEKVKVKGEGISPLYKWLTDPKLNGWNAQIPTWNFCKYLINEKGELVGFYASAIKPFSKKILKDIEK